MSIHQNRNKKIKIAIFHNLPRGGAKRYLYELVNRMQGKYVMDEFVFSTSSNYLELKKITKKRYIKKINSGNNLFSLLKMILFKLPNSHKEIAKVINKEYDVALVNHDYLTKSPYVLRYLKIPSIYICHEPPREFYEKSEHHGPLLKDKISNLIRLPIKWIDKKNVSEADVVISNSKYSQRQVKKIYGRSSKVVYPGIDCSVFKPNILFSKRKNKVLSIGSLLPYKGHDFVIHCLSKIKKELRPKLIILGGGREEEKIKLQKLALNKKVTIEIKKEISDTQLIQLYSKVKVYLSGSHNEPFGLTVLEAQACETPVVIVKEGGYGEQIINGKTGYCCTRDIQTFSSKIIETLKNGKKIGKSGRMYVKSNWNWDKSYDSLDKIINSLIKK